MKKILKHLQEEWYKYTLEIIVLIIGIYGAFALDNWNEKRIEGVQEQKIMLQLIDEYEKNLLHLEDKIAFRQSIITGAMNSIQLFDQSD